jgi:phosphatidylglycerol---prolipoprotein diacylglyceryl transferase
MLAPNIDPVAISFGAVKIHWYGLMYVLGFLALWFLASRRAKQPGSGWTTEQISDLVFYGALGVILGGRFGYMLFYNLPHYVAHPLDALKVWQGGMSFHGGLLGVLLAMLYFARKTTGKTFFTVADFIAPWVPIGLGLGRLGNFINHELWGRTTDGPWGMVFREAGPLPRHPSQLYQAALEGVALFVILWLFARKPRPTASVSGLFLVCYGLFRILVEFVREPDPQLGYLAFGWLTMGQVLSVPMILFGVGLMVWAYRDNQLDR